MPPARPSQKSRTPVRTPPPPIVDPRWVLKWGAAVFAVGLLCAYITLCTLFYVEQWQFVLNPSHTVARTPAAEGLAFQTVRFGDDAAGQPQLAGWWIPSQMRSDPTVLMLHKGDGSISDALPDAKALHDARLNVLLFDYRGFGQSGGKHPTEQRMRADTTSAFDYLTRNRSVPPSEIIVYGAGLGASLAVSLCQDHPRIPALILQAADGDTTSRVARDARSHIVPIRLFFHERFPLADALHRLRTPKLLISFTRGLAPVDATRAADPKTTVELPSVVNPAELTRVIHRFVGTYVPQPPGLLRAPAAQ